MSTQHIACNDEMFTKIPKMTVKLVIPVGHRPCDVMMIKRASLGILEPIQEEVESGESVVIPYWRLIRTGAPDVEAGTPPGGRAAWPSLSE